MSRVYIGTDYRLLSDKEFFIQLLFRFRVKLYDAFSSRPEFQNLERSLRLPTRSWESLM